MRLGSPKGKEFKTRYKHYRLSHGRRMVVPTSSKVKSTRLRARSIGRILTRIRSMIELLNPRKEEKEITIRKTKKRKKKVCIATTVKNRVTWPSIVGTRKTRDRQKARTKERTLHVKIQMILMICSSWLQLHVTMSNPRSDSSTQAARVT